VEVPDTHCPFTNEQLRQLPQTNGITYLDGMQIYEQILAMLP
jgi:hypothetical protein